MFYEENVWKENFDILIRISLMELVLFSEIESKVDLYQFCYKNYFSHSEYKESLICETLKEINQKGKLLWVLDGFDELKLLKKNDMGVANEIHTLILDDKEIRLFKNILMTSKPGTYYFFIFSSFSFFLIFKMFFYFLFFLFFFFIFFIFLFFFFENFKMFVFIFILK